MYVEASDFMKNFSFTDFALSLNSSQRSSDYQEKFFIPAIWWEESSF